MKTPTELITAYVAGERVPDDTFLRAAMLLAQIQRALSGQEWDSDTCNVIAGLMVAEGYEIKDVPTVPAGATHVSITGDFWSIPKEGYEDGTAEVWTEDGWRTSEIGGLFASTLRAI